MKTLLYTVAAVVVAAALILSGRYTASWWTTEKKPDHEHAAADPVPDEKPLGYTCPMHPQVKNPDPGKCPICGMDLTEIKRGDNLGPREFAMSQEARKLAGIETAPVTRQFLTMPVRMVGKVDYDETAVRTISARVPGRIDRMYVDYTGVPVKKGDHLVSLYSPPLLTAQEELLEAKKRIQATAREVSEFLRKSNQKAYESARDKLLLWGLTAAQVDAIEERGTAEDHMLINSPSGGVVIQKILNQGDYLKEGSKIYRIANLDKLWLRLDAYEQDLPWLRFGQRVTVQAEAVPGEVFQGWISFIDPVLHEHTRTVKVRVNISNPHGRLKPGMFVRAVVKSRIADAGRVLASRLVGKWISPMHPEIVKDGPGKCDVCGMDLVPAAEFGYVSQDKVEKPLVVPASAVLVTGTRAVVYVELSGKKRPTFEGRVIILGPRAGDHYIVRAGLRENERVVVNGAFRIDSSMQILAKPSMLSMPSESKLFIGPETSVFRASLGPVYRAYFTLQEALAGDDLEGAKAAVKPLDDALRLVDPAGIPVAAEELWHEEAGVLTTAVERALESESLASLRIQFGELSRGVLNLERSFRHPGEAHHFEVFCPMAFDDQGAPWLQTSEKVANPYFGKGMLSCGNVRDQFEGVSATIRKVDDKGVDVELGKKGDKKDDKENEKERKPEKEPKPEKKVPPPEAAAAVDDLTPVFDAYFSVQKALAADDLKAAGSAAGRLTAAVAKVEAARIPKGATAAWMDLRKASERAGKSAAIDALRVEFEAISKAVIAVHAAVGHIGERTFYRVHCPMAFHDKGADWLQATNVVNNPYFGASMLRCGRIEKELPAKKGR